MVSAVYILMCATAALMPPPQKIVPDEKVRFEIAPMTAVVVAKDITDPEKAALAPLYAVLGFTPQLFGAGAFDCGEPAIYIGEPGRHACFEKRALRKYGELLADMPDEGYIIEITRAMAVIAGKTPAGTARAVQTLLQWIAASPREWPCVKIVDAPDLPVRGVWLTAPPDMKQLDALAALKCNWLLLDSADFAQLDAARGAAWKNVFDAARIRGIEPAPVLHAYSSNGNDGIAPLAKALAPHYVCLDMQSTGTAQPDPEFLADTVLQYDATLKKALPKAKLILSGDTAVLSKAAALLPKELIVVCTAAKAGADANDAGVWKGRTLLLRADDTPAQACQAAAQAAKQNAAGVLIAAKNAGPVTQGVRSGLSKAWMLNGSLDAWSEGLNAFFGVNLWQPSLAEQWTAMIHYQNRQTLAGRSPEECRTAFDTLRETLARKLPPHDSVLEGVAARYQNLTEYLSLEAAFAAKSDPSLLRKLVEVVQKQAALDPSLTAERAKRIVETVEQQNLFVPASILFGENLLYCRKLSAAAGPLYEIPVTPEFSDKEFRATADVDLQTLVAPVYRVDFETVNAKTISLEWSADGAKFQRAAYLETASEGRAPTGPIVLEKPFTGRFARIVLESQGKQAILREVRLYASKTPPAATCAAVAAPPSMQPRSLTGWPATPQIIGFLSIENECFAETPVEARLCRTRDAFYLRVTAFDPRMHAMASETGAAPGPSDGMPDAAAESLEVQFDTAGGVPMRFAMTPSGARYDAHGNDAAWNTAWDGAAARGEASWTAVFAIPFTSLGGQPARGKAWRINLRHTRANVAVEHSAWTHDYATPDTPAYGKLLFE